MFRIFATFPDRRRPAIWKCTVTKPTVRPASLEPADHLVGASIDPAFTCTTAVFCTETLVVSVGSAARYGARLLLSIAVFLAMFRSTTVCVGGASIKLAFAFCAMLVADATCYYKGGAAFRLAHFLSAVTTVPIAVSFCYRSGSRGAVAERAETMGAMFLAEFTSNGNCTAPFS